MNIHPPRAAVRFLRWFCPPELLEGIEGDLIETFEKDATMSKRANMRFWWNVVKFFRPAIITRNRFTIDIMNLPMLKSYFKISWRHVLKNKTFAAINIAGLAVGMAAALLIYDYVSFENSFDSFHKNAPQIYRVSTIWNKHVTPDDRRATTMPWSGPEVKNAFPEVIDYAFFTPIANFTGYNSVSYKDQKISEPKIFLADNGFLRMFSFPLLAGDPERALNDPTSIVITESIARKYFANDNPMGKTLQVDTHENLTQNVYKVTGIIQDPPPNSHFDFDFLISFNVIHRELHNGSTYWHWDYTYVYLHLHPSAHVPSLEKKMAKLRVDQFGKDMQYFNDVVDFDLQPLRDIHLFSDLRGEVDINGDGRNVFFLAIIGICILLSAYINYVNLSTIKAVERKTEIGIRKVIGSTKRQLVVQLFIESLIFNLIAVVAAILIFNLSIPLIETLFNLQWHDRSNFSIPDFLVFFVGVVAAGVILSILYPAFVLSSFKPAVVLKGKGEMLPAHRGLNLRKVLIVLQFVFCVGFTIGTYAVYLQLKHMKTFDLGMNMDQVVAIRGFGFEKYAAYEKFKNQLKPLPSVKVVGATSAAPGDEILQTGLIFKVHIDGRTEPDREVKNVLIDEDYLEAIGAELVAGRTFDQSIKSDNEAVILNQAAAEALGYKNPNDIINQSVVNMSAHGLKVIGVIKNYNQRSLKQAYEPLVFTPIWKDDYGWNNRYYIVKFNPKRSLEQYQENLAQLEKAWKEVNPERPFHYFFLDTYFNNQYKADSSFSALFLFFSALAIFIACIGLFGLVAYTTLQRTKEIGVRKVLGASVKNILTLLSKDFMKLILLAMLLSVPLVAWLLNGWLNQYAFRIDITLWLFVIPLTGIFSLALLTILFKSARVATSNPVDSLRYE